MANITGRIYLNAEFKKLIFYINHLQELKAKPTVFCEAAFGVSKPT